MWGPRFVVSAVALSLVGLFGCSDQGFIPQKGDQEAGPDITVDPDRLDFDSSRSPIVQTFTITNDGSLDLKVDHLELEAPSGFTLLDTSAFSLSSGESASFDVAYVSDPGDDAEVYGDVWVFSNDPDEDVVGIDLTGQALAPIIRIDPVVYDFGTPYIGCELERPYAITNEGNADLVIDALDFAGSADLVFDNPNVLPLRLDPGGIVGVSVRYLGLDEVADDGELIARSNDPVTPEYVASAHGAAVSYLRNVDLFQQPLQPKADILFVVDNSISMTQEQANLTANFQAFIDAILLADADYQVAVITTDDPALRGPLITPATSNPISEFTSQAAVGTSGDAHERPMEMAYDATQTTGDAGPGSAFLRDDAILAIIVVTDEADEYSTLTPSDYVDYWLSLKGDDPDLVRFHAIGGDVPVPACVSAAHASVPLDETAALTGGVFLSVCGDWGTSLTAVAAGSVQLDTSFELSDEPLISTVEVTVDGLPVTSGWTYDAVTRSVVFDTTSVPPAGAMIDIAYELVPDCAG
jgi:hypothetical protein